MGRAENEDHEAGGHCEGEEMTMKSWNGMNILDYIDWLMEQGISEENANEIADNEFNLN